MRRAPAPPPFEIPKPRGGEASIVFTPGRTISQAVLESAGTDNQNLVGLTIEDERTRYKVVGTTVLSQSRPQVEERKIGLPRFMWIDGKRVFQRPTIVTNMKPTGLPHYAKYGKDLRIERTWEALPQQTTETEMVVVAEYDDSRDAVDIKECPRDQFLGLIDGLGQQGRNQVKGSWASRAEDNQELSLELTGRDREGNTIGPYEEICEQLRGAGISSWKGIKWQRGNLHQEVVFDEAIRQRTHNGLDLEWERYFVVKTTGQDGKSLPLERFRGYLFPTYLKALNTADSPEHSQPMRNIRLVRPKTEEAADVTPVMSESRIRRLANVVFSRLSGDTLKTKLSPTNLASYIHSQISHGPEKSLRRSQNEQIALWLLNYPDILSEDQRQKNMRSITKTVAGKKRIQSLKEALERGELVTIWEIAIKAREDYFAAAKRISLPLGPEDVSLSKAFEIIADSLAETVGFSSIFSDKERAKGILVNRMVGRTATKVGHAKEMKNEKELDLYMLQVDRKLKPTGELNALGMPANEIVEEIVFNEKFFTRHDPPAISSQELKLWHQRDRFREPVIKRAKAVSVKIANDVSVGLEELEDLGDKLRRLYGA